MALLTMAATSGCIDLEVTNINEPDAERALSNPGDVETLISASYHSWFEASLSAASMGVGTPGFFLSDQAFQSASPWMNWGLETYGRIPRAAVRNDVAHKYYPVLAYAWVGCYRAISALANGLKALEDPELAKEIGDEELTRLRAYGRFVQGLAHGTVALLYARGFVMDETTDLTQAPSPVGHTALMEQALAYLDEAIGTAASENFTIPFDWMRAELDAQGLVRLAHSYKARFRAQVTRTPEERAAVDWSAVMADVEAGIQATHTIDMDWNAGWYSYFRDFATWYNFSQLPYFISVVSGYKSKRDNWLRISSFSGV